MFLSNLNRINSKSYPGFPISSPVVYSLVGKTILFAIYSSYEKSLSAIILNEGFLLLLLAFVLQSKSENKFHSY